LRPGVNLPGSMVTIEQIAAMPVDYIEFAWLLELLRQAGITRTNVISGTRSNPVSARMPFRSSDIVRNEQ